MKLKNKLATTLLALSVLGFTAPGTSLAQNGQEFKVSKYNLTGYTDQAYISSDVRAELVQLLKSYTGDNVTVAKLNELKGKIQTLLNKAAKGVFTVSIPNQKITNGTVEFNVNFIAAKVNYTSAPGYSKQNVINSIPSLAEGVQFIAGRPWLDERELTMAVENPLKLTQVEYELQPGKPITANVNVIAPRGSNIRYVTVDNSASKDNEYVRAMFGYINANTTGKDDVLALILVANPLRSLSSYLAFGGSYSKPFYSEHQRLDLSLFHAGSKVEKPQGEGGSSVIVETQGKGDILTANWSYYLPHYDWSYSNQLKFNVGYTFKRMAGYAGLRSGENTTTIQDAFYFVSPLSVGFSGKIVPVRGYDIDFNFKYNFFYAGALGTDNINKLRTAAAGNRLVTAEKFEDWWTLSATFRAGLPKNWTWSTSVNAQYTNKHLVQSERFGNSARGIRENAGQGDYGAYVRNDLISPNLSTLPNLDAKAYAFVDAGFVRYNRGAADVENNSSLNYNSEYTNKDEEITKEKRTKVIASTGLGLRTSYKDITADTYVAYRIKGKKDGHHDRVTFWWSVNYKW